MIQLCRQASSLSLDVRRKEKKRKSYYIFQQQFDDKPSIVTGSPGSDVYRYAHHKYTYISIHVYLYVHIHVYTNLYIYCILSASHTSAAKQEADSFHPSTSSRIQAHQCGPRPGQRSSSVCTCELVQSVSAQTRPCMSAAQHAAAVRESPDAPELSCALL